MNFNGIEHFDHFQWETIFWAEFSDPPAELKSKAMLIDGDNYNETCFGVCVAYDAETKKFAFVVDMKGDEACAIYYIDNDGDKHWFAYEIPEELAKLTFSECQQIIDFKKIEYGYEIKREIEFENGSGFVLAEKPTSEQPFLTADFTPADRGQRYYGEWRAFCQLNDAINDYTQRVEYKKQFLCVKQGQIQSDKRQNRGMKQANSRKNRPKRKRR